MPGKGQTRDGDDGGLLLLLFPFPFYFTSHLLLLPPRLGGVGGNGEAANIEKGHVSARREGARGEAVLTGWPSSDGRSVGWCTDPTVELYAGEARRGRLGVAIGWHTEEEQTWHGEACWVAGHAGVRVG